MTGRLDPNRNQQYPGLRTTAGMFQAGPVLHLINAHSAGRGSVRTVKISAGSIWRLKSPQIPALIPAAVCSRLSHRDNRIHLLLQAGGEAPQPGRDPQLLPAHYQPEKTEIMQESRDINGISRDHRQQQSGTTNTCTSCCDFHNKSVLKWSLRTNRN